MAKQSPLEMLIDIQEEKVEEALNSVALAQQTLSEAKTQLDTLLRYRREYEQQFRIRAKDGIKPTHLHNYQAFMSKLNHAIDHQTALIVQLERQLEVKQAEWIDEKNQFNAYGKLKERQDKVKQDKENRREQKLSDEYGAKKFADRQQNEALEDAEESVHWS